jgi:hypothetical protein
MQPRAQALGRKRDPETSPERAKETWQCGRQQNRAESADHASGDFEEEQYLELIFFRPYRALVPLSQNKNPGLAPWAAFFRRFAAFRSVRMCLKRSIRVDPCKSVANS